MTNFNPFGNGSIDDLLATVRKVAGVGDAAAAVRRDVRSAPVRKPKPRVAVAASDDIEGPPADLDGGPLRIPDGAPATLQDALRSAAELAPDHGTIFVTQGNPDVLQTYPELLDEAQHVLAGLRAVGLRPGDAALFVFDDNRQYLTAFWACVLGGFVPTPVAVATTYASPNEVNRKLRHAWQLLGRPVLLTDAGTAGSLAGVRALWGEPDVRIHTVEDLLGHPADTDWFPTTPDSPVLNLLTSGSTGVPKCVQHTNASVAARTHAAAQDRGITSADVTLTVMPFDHVTVPMHNVRDVFLRCMHVNAKTNHFLEDCLLLLDWIDRYRVTNLWVPNFGYAMINERAAEIRERSWDLSCVREMINGAEPVIVSTSHRFLELLAPHGLPADVMTPCWGMSEICSGVTHTTQSRDDRTAGTVAIDPATLSRTIRQLDPTDRDALVLAAVGRPIPGVRLRVVDEDGRVLPEDRMGELRVHGRTTMRGYFGNPEAQREAFDENGWFRTGDLAFVHDGEVVIAGRIKDQIIVRGINYLAHELESVVEQVDGVRVTFTAAAGVREPGAGSDRLAIFFVPESWDHASLSRIAADVRAVLGREAGLAPDLLVPVTEAEFPKTGSGKIQRAALVNELGAGTFDHRVIGRESTDAAADTWLARRQWSEVPAIAAGDHGGATLVLAEDSDLRYLGIDGLVAVAGRGDGYCEELPGRFRVAATDRAQLRRLLTVVTQRHGPLSTVVFALPLSARGEPLDRLTSTTAELTALLAALHSGEFGTPRVRVLTAGSVYVRPGDHIDFGTCALPGLIRTAASELTSFSIRQLDLPADRGAWAEAVRAELADQDSAGIVAARDRKRWQPRLAPVGEDEQNTSEPPVIAGGLYLITGGLGGIAHEIAGYLAADHGVRSVLVGRSPATGPKADRLAELAAIGDVSYHQLDVANADTLEAVVSAAETRCGRRLDGVLHLAGADPTGQWADLDRHLIVNESMTTFTEQYRAKVAGTLAIARVLSARPHASLTLFGSVNGEFGGHGFSAYSAANSFLTGFADYWYRERGRAVRCVAWSMWTGVGMNRTQPTAAARHRGFRAIEPAAGLRLFLTAVALPHHYLLAGLDLTNPAILDEVLADQVGVRELVVAYTTSDAEPEAVGAAVAARVRECPVPVRLIAMARIPKDADGTVDTTRILLEATPGRPRRTYAAPATDLERRLARIWSDALNHSEIGRDISFFELGGNSLAAARLIALVDRELGIRMRTHELYENPTVAGMAAAAARSGTDVSN
jgi:acyl-CoA synthetase (AMP-forming)/AMP-acid ligase II/NADP-dependent 3-hydroxy acid dehydrogenase YdfG